MKTSITISMGITITVQKVGISLSISISFRLGFSRSLAKIVVSSIGSVVGTIGIGVVKPGVQAVSIGAVKKSGVSLSVSLGLGFGRSLAKIVVSTIGSVVGAIGIGVVKTGVCCKEE